MKRGRGRPPTPFDLHTPDCVERIYRQRKEALSEWRRKAGILKAGQPKGFRVPGCKDDAGRPAIIPYSRICLEVDVMLDLVAENGKRLSEREAVRAALAQLMKRFGFMQKLYPGDLAVETALRKIRAYRKAHPHEYPERFKK
jgi:hypothetical protein